ncbi:MAG: galactose-1-phosphate uridylyltransferase [Candidatus Melainabacteria bacterium]|nr:galactose-1-phosphate uridylyltransferase [Candidatus Melainabacteria bacterium]
MVKPELRQNKITNNWTLYAPHRSTRPMDHKKKKNKQKYKLPKYEKECPFCPGNEKMLPSVISEIRNKNSWFTRIVSNKYPVLLPEEKQKKFNDVTFPCMLTSGNQEVIVEHPMHNKNISSFSTCEFENLLKTYRKRFDELIRIKSNKFVFVFRNHGEGAGASRIHPHSQIVSLGFVPAYIQYRENNSKKFFHKHGRSIYKTLLEREKKEKKRMLFENDAFLAFVPYAAEVKCELWILPKKQRANFGKITNKEIILLAKILKKTLERLHEKLKNPDYNLVLYSASKHNIKASYLCWHIQIRPKLSRPAGFEIVSGMNVNPSLPEIDAKFLRNH